MVFRYLVLAAAIRLGIVRAGVVFTLISGAVITIDTPGIIYTAHRDYLVFTLVLNAFRYIACIGYNAIIMVHTAAKPHICQFHGVFAFIA